MLEHRKIFVSMPDEVKFKTFIANELGPAIRTAFPKFSLGTYMKIQGGEIWLDEIHATIRRCLVSISFLEDCNPNVMYETGQVVALGKPLLIVIPTSQRIPGMISNYQAIKYRKQLTPAVCKRITSAMENAIFKHLHKESSNERTEMHAQLIRFGAISKHRATLLRKYTDKKSLSIAEFDERIKRYKNKLKKKNPTAEDFFALADMYFLRGEAGDEGIEQHQCYLECLDVCV